MSTHPLRDGPQPNKRRRMNQFIDQEARDADEEMEEGPDDTNPCCDGSLVGEDHDSGCPNTGDDSTSYASHEVSIVQHTRLRQAMQAATAEFWTQLIQRASARAQVHARTRTPAFDSATVDSLEVGDWPLWEVACKVGQEEMAVFSVMQQAVVSNQARISIRSAFSRPSLLGRIFIEAENTHDARKAASGIAPLEPLHITPFPLTFDSLRDLLRSGKPLYRPTYLSWVQLRTSDDVPSLYNGDIGAVIHVSRSGLLDVLAIPRIAGDDLWTKKRSCPTPPHARPEPRILDQSQRARAMGPGGAVAVPYGKHSGQEGGSLVYQVNGQCFTDDGFLVLRGLDGDSYHPECVYPSRPALDQFGLSLCIRPAFNNAMAHRSKLDLQVGARVKILRGEFVDLIGKILEINDDAAVLYVPSQDVTQETAVNNLRIDFCVGDAVSVATGPDAGRTGFIVSVNGKSHSVWDPVARDELQVPIQCLVFEQTKTIGIRPQQRQSNKYENICLDPNSIYIGKKIIVIGSSSYKGYKGIITATTASGQAEVELNTLGCPRVRLALGSLSIDKAAQQKPLQDLSKDTAGPTSYVPGLSRHDLTSDPVPSRSTPPTQPQTPMPAGPTALVSPAWNPTPISPLSNLTWLQEPIFSNLRIKLVQSSRISEDQVLQGSSSLEFLDIDQETGHACVRDGWRTRVIPFSELRALGPTDAKSLVVAIEGAYKGRVLKLTQYGETVSSVLPLGVRVQNKKRHPVEPTRNLVQVWRV